MAFRKGTRDEGSTVPGPLAPLEAVCAEAAGGRMRTVTRGCTEFAGSLLAASGNRLLGSGTALSWPGLAGLLSRKFTQNALVDGSPACSYFSALRLYKNLIGITGGSWNLQVSPELRQKKFLRGCWKVTSYLYPSVYTRPSGVTLKVQTTRRPMSSTDYPFHRGDPIRSRVATFAANSRLWP